MKKVSWSRINTGIKNSFDFLNEKPKREEVTKANLYDFVISREYKKNQELIFWTAFFAYMIYYFTRQQWTVFGSTLMEDKKVITSDQFALVGSIFSISYGIFKFISSPLSDTKSNRWLLGIGLLGAGTINLFIGLTWMNLANITAQIIGTCVLVIIAGWFHSFGATPCVRFFYNWFNHKSRRNRIITWNISHNIGTALVTILILSSYSWLSSSLGNLAYFILPSIISLIAGIFVIIFAKNSPISVGLPPLQKFYNMELIGVSKKSSQQKDNNSWGYYFYNYVVKNKYVWLLAISNMLIYTFRMGINDWTLKYLTDVHNLNMKGSGKWIYSMFNWGAALLTVVVGLIANKYCKRFAPFTFVIILIAVLGCVGVWQAQIGSVWQLSLSLMICGAIFIPQCFLPIMVSEFSHYRVVSTSAGVLGIAGYFGDAIISKFVIGSGLIRISWSAIYIFLIVCGVVAALLLIPMFKKQVAHN